MESNRKRRGFIKGKLMMPLYRVAKSSSSTTVQYSSKVKPSQTSPATATVGYIVHHQQDYVIAHEPKQKVSSFINNVNVPSDHNNNRKKLFGVAADETVDIKAAIYISSVQERFKLERVNSDRMKYQDSTH